MTVQRVTFAGRQATSAIGPHGIISKWERITPEYAARILDRNLKTNRPISPANLAGLKRDMLANAWRYTHEGIAFDANGMLVDGQHRLTAIRDTGVSIELLVTRGLPFDAFQTLNSGKRRNIPDRLGTFGMKNRKIVATCGRLIWMYDHGHGLLPNRMDQKNRPTDREIVEYIRDNDEIVEASQFTVGLPRFESLSTAGTLSSLLVLLRRIDDAKAEQFIFGITSGEDLARGNPILTARNKMISLKSREGISFTRADQLGIMILAWNKWIRDRECRRISWKSGDQTPEILKPSTRRRRRTQ